MNYSSKLAAITMVVLIGFVANSASAQAKNAATPSPQKAGLPSEATVEDFLKQMFGWNQELTWKIADIKPAEAQGFSEVTAIFNTPQGQQVFRLYVTPDQ